MELVLMAILLTGCVYFALYQFKGKLFGMEETHLPPEMFDKESLEKEAAYNKYTQKLEQAFSPLSGTVKVLERRFPLPIAGVRRRLVKAGLPMGATEFFIFKALSFIVVPVLAYIFLGEKLPKDMVFLVSLAVGFFLPEMWLNGKIKSRQAKIRKGLPNIIDLLNLCVSGGMDFMLAVNRIIKDLKPCDLTQELAEVYHETQMGKTRREALKNLAWRVDMPEVHSFVRTLVQADRMGTPMAEAMNLQAEEMRYRRFQNGESMALKAPIKLLFPLFAFILPVVLIIVGGPILLQFTRGGLNVGM
ncbi:MAG: type II secretion system F family protein [Candidatus Omnitrophota bacterium]